jgi:hypothetical protein
VHRAWLARGCRSRRPRHAVRHRQAPHAVAAARQGLAQNTCPPDPGGVRLAEVDACAVHRPPRPAKVWQPRGQPMRGPAAGAARQFVLCGALEDATGQGHWQLSGRKAREALLTCLAPWRPAWPDAPRVMVLDNGGDHQRRQPLAWGQPWQDRRCPCFRPADSPEWHLRERVWRTVKDPWSCHRWWADWQALGEATATRLAHLNARSHRGKGRALAIGHNCCASA